MTFFDEFIISRAFLAFWIYFWFTWLWVHRYFVELLDATNLRRYWLSRKLGKGFIYSFYYYVFLVNKNKYFMNFLFSYESNIRWSAILGSIGIFGIGSLFKNYQSDSSYLGITVLFLMLTIFSFELILFLFNRFLSSQKGFYKKEQVFSKSLRYNWQKYLFWGFFAIILFLVIFSFWKISKLSEGQAIFNAQQFQKSFKTLFSLNFEDVTKNPKIYLVYFDMLKQSYVALVFGTLWAIVFAYNASEKISLWFNSLGHKFLLSLIKAVPILIFFRLINPLLATQAAITLALSISVFRSLVKQIISGINSLSQKQLSSLKKLYGSKFKMYYNFVLPHLYKLIRGNFIFEIENTYRNALNYSLFTGIGVYSRISYYQKYDNDHYIFAYLFPAFLFFLIIELSLWFIKEKQIFSQLLLPIIRLKQKQQE
ncbi:hypothetical protein [Mycoplasmopsis gallopavonis]|nr:hypothetical protein [Mycoplasmopsis gallopavonis]